MSVIPTPKQPTLSSLPGCKHRYVGSSGIEMCPGPSCGQAEEVVTHLADWAQKDLIQANHHQLEQFRTQGDIAVASAPALPAESARHRLSAHDDSH
jgi:hypothetical protein